MCRVSIFVQFPVVLVVVIIIFASLTANCSAKVLKDVREETASYWNEAAQNTLSETLKLRTNENVAKNIIFFLGDGMGVTTVTAARIFKGQRLGNPGEEHSLEFEKFPYVSLIKTYNVDHQVPDSAGTATAYLCGVKTNYEMVGVTAKVTAKNCSSVYGQEVSSILQWAQEAGKDTGFITTTRVTHASPAGLYAHSANRYWEVDSKLPENATECKDIAQQLIEDVPGKNIKVIMGGGRGFFISENETDQPTSKKGSRQDGRNLIDEWLQDKKAKGANAKYMADKKGFDQWNPEETDYAMGLFGYNHMDYEKERDESPSGQPSLAEMTTKAIRLLSKNPKGFFLFVEGGRIDHAHHDGYSRLALEETAAMDDAVKVAVDLTNERDTTILVTADHSHVMTFNGYQSRGNPIFGIAGVSDIDNMSYTTLMYTNGPGYAHNGTGRANLTGVDTAANRFQPQVAVLLKEETHGGEDVAAYVRGPMAHLFHGVREQNYLPHALAYAACIGSNKGHCKDNYEVPNSPSNDEHSKPSEPSGTWTNRSNCLEIPLMLMLVCICSIFIPTTTKTVPY